MTKITSQLNSLKLIYGLPIKDECDGMTFICVQVVYVIFLSLIFNLIINMKKILLYFLLASYGLSAQVPTPKSHFGFHIGDNYHLANFTQTEAYLKKVAASSPRVKLQSIGSTEEGRNQYMVIVSDPANIKNLAKYKAISQRLARAENLTENEAKSLVKEGKAIVWIDGVYFPD